MILKFSEFPPSESHHIWMDDEAVDSLYLDIKDSDQRVREIGRQVGSTLQRVMESPTIGGIVDMADGLKESSKHLWHTPANEVPYLTGVIQGALYMETALKQEQVHERIEA